MSISPNACVIVDEQPQFLSVGELIRLSALQTKGLLREELEIRQGELEEKWHFASLEKIFIEQRIYRRIEKEETWEGVIKTVDVGLKPHKALFHREITEDDILRLLEIRIKRISKYNVFKADEIIKGYEKEIAEVKRNLKQLTKYTIRYYKELLKKYGKKHERKTEIATFDRIVASQVATANETLYINRKDGFAGWSLKRDVPMEKCSRLDDVIVFSKNGTVKVTRIQEKFFIGKNPVHTAIFRKDEPKTYAMIYRDGKTGKTFAKRFQIGGVTRDKDYELIKHPRGSRIWFFAAYDDDTKTEKLLVHLSPEARARNKVLEVEIAEMPVKNRGAIGITVTKYKVDRVTRAPRNEKDQKPPPEATKSKADQKGKEPKKKPESKKKKNRPQPKKQKKPKVAGTKPAKQDKGSAPKPRVKKGTRSSPPAQDKRPREGKKSTSDFLQGLLDFDKP